MSGHLRAPGPASKGAVRCFKCDCCDEVRGILFLQVDDPDQDEPLFLEVPLLAPVVKHLAWEFKGETEDPPPGYDGGAAIPYPYWFDIEQETDERED